MPWSGDTLAGTVVVPAVLVVDAVTRIRGDVGDGEVLLEKVESGNLE